MTTDACRRRVAIVGLFDSEERDKMALIAHGLQLAGHTPVLVDAELFAAARCGFGRTPSGGPSIVTSDVIHVVEIDDIRGRHRTRTGTLEHVHLATLAAITAEPSKPPISSTARVRVATALPANSAIPIDAVWPEALDITRRLEFESLYQGLAQHQIPTLAGRWESVLSATFKHRTRAILGSPDVGIPQPQTEILYSEMSDADIERARQRLATPDVWVKAPNDSHGRGVHRLLAHEKAAPAARNAMRETPDGNLCLMEEDVCGTLKDTAGQAYRADIAITVLDGRAIHASLRVQPRRGSPTNSLHGGHSLAIDATLLPRQLRQLAIDAVTATGNRYGSTDVLGGLIDIAPYAVLNRPTPVVCEVNIMPGGRSPGFLDRVVAPLVAAYLALPHTCAEKAG